MRSMHWQTALNHLNLCSAALREKASNYPETSSSPSCSAYSAADTSLYRRRPTGDLEVAFRDTYAHGGYLRSAAIPAGTPPAGVPFGMYFDLTPAGRTEWDLPEYESFVEERTV
jgi:hypothetical protein